MQLVLVALFIFLLMSFQEVKAQRAKFTEKKKFNPFKKDYKIVGAAYQARADWNKIELDFLSSYYSQDGNNSAVTGGLGTEQLTDFTQKISLVVPTGPKMRISLNTGYDYYSSASTDNIDNVRSSDSIADVRTHAVVGLEYDYNEQVATGMQFGTSVEYDYTSINGGLSLGLQSKDANQKLALSWQSYFDTWTTYFPSELRGEASVPTKNRQSHSFSLAYHQVLNRRMQVSLMGEVNYMKGLLSTPFHRVYFQEREKATIEHLPSERFKVPVGIRLNTYLSEHLILRSYYRYYWDNWGMQAHTLSIELPVKLTRFFALYPHYRYHTQTAVDYFDTHKSHTEASTYYTSDHDLSDLNSHCAGLGGLYSPAGGIFGTRVPFTKGRKLNLESIDLKSSIYARSTGLDAWIVSVGAKFSF